MNLTITRTYGDLATTGTCLVNGKTLYTIERPWINNESGESCIPEGTYDLKPYLSPTHGQTWIVEVPGRTFIELHAANWSEQLQGCIAFGFDGQPMYDPLTGRVEPAVEDSKDAISYLLAQLGPMSIGNTLTIHGNS